MAAPQYVCPHCSSYLSKKAYRAHRRLYYDPATDQWLKKREVETDILCPVEFDDSEASSSGLSKGPIGSMESDRPPVIDLLSSEEVLTSIEDIVPPGELWFTLCFAKIMVFLEQKFIPYTAKLLHAEDVCILSLFKSRRYILNQYWYS